MAGSSQQFRLANHNPVGNLAKDLSQDSLGQGGAGSVAFEQEPDSGAQRVS
jgi:hypothetical protein